MYMPGGVYMSSPSLSVALWSCSPCALNAFAPSESKNFSAFDRSTVDGSRTEYGFGTPSVPGAVECVPQSPRGVWLTARVARDRKRTTADAAAPAKADNRRRGRSGGGSNQKPR